MGRRAWSDRSVGRAEPDRPVVLVVDDDPGMRQTVRLVAHLHGVEVTEADNGATALAKAKSQRFDLALVDFRLPDMSGLDLIKALKEHCIDIPWILISGWMTISIAVEATKLGALEALPLPFDVDNVLMSALAEAAKVVRWPPTPLGPRLRTPKSSAERWAWLVVRACDAQDDLSTLQEWASFVGLSYRSLTESCRLVGVSPHEARDFVRILRVLLQCGGRSENLELALIVSDQRTLKRLFRRAGFDSLHPIARLSPAQFLDQQQFIDPRHKVIDVLRRILSNL